MPQQHEKRATTTIIDDKHNRFHIYTEHKYNNNNNTFFNIGTISNEVSQRKKIIFFHLLWSVEEIDFFKKTAIIPYLA